MHQLKEILRDNHVPKITKALRKAIPKRSELETKSVRSKTSDQDKKYFALNCIRK